MIFNNSWSRVFNSGMILGAAFGFVIIMATASIVIQHNTPVEPIVIVIQYDAPE